MTAFNAQRKPTFFWQGLLILLPVIVLAVVGIYSLKQDKAQADGEAIDRAQAIANELLPAIWNDLTAINHLEASSNPSFQVDQQGELLFPAPYSPVPIPHPLNKAALKNTEQLALWFAAQEADRDTSNTQAAITAWKNSFSVQDMPQDFVAIANYRLFQLYSETGDTNAAFRHFMYLCSTMPDAVSESGLALKPMAELSVLEAGVFTNRLFGDARHPEKYESITSDSICSNLVYEPTFLSPYLLRKVSEIKKIPAAAKDAEKWLQIWEEHERARELFKAAKPELLVAMGTNLSAVAGQGQKRPHPIEASIEARRAYAEKQKLSHARRVSLAVNSMTLNASTGVIRSARPRFLWFNAPPTPQQRENHWLAIEADNDLISYRFVCFGESEIGRRLTQLLADKKIMPEYFGVGITLFGQKISANAPDTHLWEFESYHSRGSDGEKRKNLDTLATNVLATAQSLDAGRNLLKVSVYLTSPAALYKRQSARTIWVGALIAVSAIAAIIGFWAAWKAFRRQLRLSEMKSNFVSSVSHELRAPIASVRLMAEGLERGKIQDPQKQHEYFRFITQECRRLSSLIENVLDFSRIEQGRKQYEMESTDLVALTQQTVKLMETYAAEQQMEIALSIKGEPAPLELDGKAMQQALINLIDNAIKHSPKGAKVEVGLDFGAEDETSEVHSASTSLDAIRDTQYATQLWVEDRGEGIPAAEHEKIFERFYRVGSELRRQTQGVGIGLSIVKHIVEAHGGKVVVRSAPGEGSRFTILLPR